MKTRINIEEILTDLSQLGLDKNQFNQIIGGLVRFHSEIKSEFKRLNLKFEPGDFKIIFLLVLKKTFPPESSPDLKEIQRNLQTDQLTEASLFPETSTKLSLITMLLSAAEEYHLEIHGVPESSKESKIDPKQWEAHIKSYEEREKLIDDRLKEYFSKPASSYKKETISGRKTFIQACTAGYSELKGWKKFAFWGGVALIGGAIITASIFSAGLVGAGVGIALIASGCSSGIGVGVSATTIISTKSFKDYTKPSFPVTTPRRKGDIILIGGGSTAHMGGQIGGLKKYPSQKFTHEPPHEPVVTTTTPVVITIKKPLPTQEPPSSSPKV